MTSQFMMSVILPIIQFPCRLYKDMDFSIQAHFYCHVYYIKLSFLGGLNVTHCVLKDVMHFLSRGGSKTLETFKVELFLTIVNGSKLLTFVTKSSTLEMTWINMAKHDIWLHLRYEVSCLLLKKSLLLNVSIYLLR